MGLCSYTKPVTKTIGLSDGAYDRLATLKKDGESFSDVVERLTGAPLLRRLVGTMDEETARHYRSVIDEARDRQDADRRDRVDRLLDDPTDG